MEYGSQGTLFNLFGKTNDGVGFMLLCSGLLVTDTNLILVTILPSPSMGDLYGVYSIVL